MKNFIEELFYGNIDPQARGYTQDSNIKKVSDKINDIEEQLTNKLNKEEKNCFLILLMHTANCRLNQALTHSLLALD